LGRIISIHSFRGGTGKSNLTASLATTVACAGHRVAIVDTDIQSPGIHVLFGIKDDPDRRCLNDFLWGRCKIEDAACDVTDVLPSSNHGSSSALFLIPSSLKAGDITRILQEGYEVSILSDGFLQLVKALALDYLFIDTHPGVNEETLLSIAISDKLFVVLRPDHQDFQGTAVTVELARRLQVAEMALLVNKIPATMDMQGLREQVERVYQTPVAGMFPLTMELVQVASSGVFCLRFPSHPFTAEVQGVARRIMK
jgi:MinD-like ATPase involved in chromosome partitioning or flagellar assembly